MRNIQLLKACWASQRFTTDLINLAMGCGIRFAVQHPMLLKLGLGLVGRRNFVPVSRWFWFWFWPNDFAGWPLFCVGCLNYHCLGAVSPTAWSGILPLVLGNFACRCQDRSRPSTIACGCQASSTSMPSSWCQQMWAARFSRQMSLFCRQVLGAEGFKWFQALRRIA